MSEISLKDFDILSQQDQAEAIALLNRFEQLKKQESCRKDFITYLKHLWPDFIEGRHHKIIGEKFNRIAEGKLKRLIVCLPPRHSKSEFASTYFPSWMMGLRGNLKIIQTTHTAELAVRFGRKVRNIIDSQEYSTIFPDLKLQNSSQLESEELSLDEALIYLSLTIRILSKTLCRLQLWSRRMNGTPLALGSVCNREG